MPIEIRELIIKTEIASAARNNTGAVKAKDLDVFKKQVLDECKRIISENSKKYTYKR